MLLVPESSYSEGITFRDEYPTRILMFFGIMILQESVFYFILGDSLSYTKFAVLTTDPPYNTFSSKIQSHLVYLLV